MNQERKGDHSNLDGWLQVFYGGEIYYELYDDGMFVIRCTRAFRDKILAKSRLPLKLIDSGIEGLITDF